MPSTMHLYYTSLFDLTLLLFPRTEMEAGSRGSPCTKTLLVGTDLHHYSNLTLCLV